MRCSTSVNIANYTHSYSCITNLVKWLSITYPCAVSCRHLPNQFRALNSIMGRGEGLRHIFFSCCRPLNFCSIYFCLNIYIYVYSCWLVFLKARAVIFCYKPWYCLFSFILEGKIASLLDIFIFSLDIDFFSHVAKFPPLITRCVHLKKSINEAKTFNCKTL